MVDCPVVSSMSWRACGELELRVDGDTVGIGGPKRAMVAGLLLAAEGDIVRRDALIEGVWGPQPPRSAVTTLHTYVSQLRSAMGAHRDRLVTTQVGYRLEVTDDEWDLGRFARAASLASERQGHLGLDAAEHALDIWHGEPFTGLEADSIAVVRERYVARYLGLLARRVELLVSVGEHRVAAERASDLVALAPFDEHAAALQVEALSRSGRARDALNASTAFRHRLGTRSGLEPGSLLKLAEDRILNGSPSTPEREQTDVRETRTPSRGPQRLIGRERELALLDETVRPGRVVTITGFGGSGKTSLALAFAASWPAQVHVVELAGIAGDRDVDDAVVRSVGTNTSRYQGAVASAREALGPGQLLLIDNCEHVVSGVRHFVDQLRARVDDIAVLLTSRRPVEVHREQLLPIAGLGDPATDRWADAIELFRLSAGEAVPERQLDARDLEPITHIVRRLGGMPLALELAAARLRHLTLADINDRLDDAPGLLKRRDGTDRTDAISATIDWSTGLLDAHTAATLEDLSVFRAPFELAAAEFVAAALDDEVVATRPTPFEAITTLVDHHLLTLDRHSDRSWFHILEPVAQHGRKRLLVSGRHDDTLERYTQWWRSWSLTCGHALTGPSAPEWAIARRRVLPDLLACFDHLHSAGRVDDAAQLLIPAVWSSHSDQPQRTLAARAALLADEQDLTDADQVSILGLALFHAIEILDRDLATRLLKRIDTLEEGPAHGFPTVISGRYLAGLWLGAFDICTRAGDQGLTWATRANDLVGIAIAAQIRHASAMHADQPPASTDLDIALDAARTSGSPAAIATVTAATARWRHFDNEHEALSLLEESKSTSTHAHVDDAQLWARLIEARIINHAGRQRQALTALLDTLDWGVRHEALDMLLTQGLEYLARMTVHHDQSTAQALSAVAEQRGVGFAQTPHWKTDTHTDPTDSAQHFRYTGWRIADILHDVRQRLNTTPPETLAS